MSRAKPHLRSYLSLSFLALLLGVASLSTGCEEETCEWGGNTYSAGESWDCDCNKCQCGDDGEISSTLIACLAGAPGK